jgi:hypothetical protein
VFVGNKESYFIVPKRGYWSLRRTKAIVAGQAALSAKVLKRDNVKNFV